jgi:hypothetical protein
VNQRYFEDVTVGEELPPVEKLPTEHLAVEFFRRAGEPPPTLERMPVAREGFEGVLVPGVLKVSWLTQFVSDWAGPGAELASIRVAYRRPDTTGQPLLLTGKVVDKAEVDGQKVVDIEVATVAAEGPSVRGTARLRLPGRPGD